jgi:hypothetical protein
MLLRAGWPRVPALAAAPVAAVAGSGWVGRAAAACSQPKAAQQAALRGTQSRPRTRNWVKDWYFSCIIAKVPVFIRAHR